MGKHVITLAAIVAISVSATSAGQTRASVADNYQWSGELVSFDDSVKTATIKARLVDREAVAELQRLKAGDRANLLWSGYDTYADAIRRVMAYSADRKGDERFLLPAELVSTEAPNQFVTFRLRVPDSQAAPLKFVEPGEWVTVTSSHRASRDAAAVVSIRPYSTPPAASTH